jgi:homeodomain-containing protein/DDE superfamily endonuclease
MPGTAAKIRVSEKQLAVLEEFRRSRTQSRAVVQRASIVVLGFQGLFNERIAEDVGLNRQQVGVWRQRWREAWVSLCVWECQEPHRLREGILEVLSDAPRPGAPGTFTAEQVAAIVAVACESPKLSDRPINRWTHRELRDEVIKRQIVVSISVAQVGRYLQQSAVQPHRSKMWLNTTEKNGEKFEREAATVCQAYLDAPHKAQLDGTHTVSVDEATSLQALERNAPDKPVQPGRVTKQEFEYTRHGTTTLTAGLDIVTGQIIAPTLEATRTEPEFVAHIARTVNLAPTGEWVFIVDNLNTHASESLVQWVAEQCGATEALGKKRPRHPEVHDHSPRVPRGHVSPHPLRLPAETQLLAEPDRNLLRHPATKMPPRRQLQIGARTGIPTATIHHLLQHDDGPPLQLDVHRQTPPKEAPFLLRPSPPSR